MTWTWGNVTEKVRGGLEEFIRVCNVRFKRLEVLLRTIQAGLLGWVTPEQFGAAGDGVTDDTAAVAAAVAAAGTGVVLFRRTYRVTSPITVTATGQKWIMLGYLQSKLLKAHTGNGVVIQGAGWEADGLVVDGDVGTSATYAQGSALRLESNNPKLRRFHLMNVDILLDFPADGGKYGQFADGLVDPYTQTAGSEGRCIYLRGVDTNAMHREFVNITGQGIVDFGQHLDALFTNCIFRRPVWSSSSSSLTFLNNCIWGALNQAMTIDGSNTVVSDCRFAGAITLAGTMSGACVFADNIQTFGTFTDNSPVNVCMVRHHPLTVNYHLLDKHKVYSGSSAGGVVRTQRNVSPGDADYTWTPYEGVSDILYSTTLTAVRTVTLSSSGAETGASGLVRRTASGAFLLDVGGLVNLAPYEWCAWTYTGSGYVITAAGKLRQVGRLDTGLWITENTMSGTTQYGLIVDSITQSDATNLGVGVYARAQTAAAAFNQTTNVALYAAAPNVGAGSTITNAVGLLVENITEGSTSNKAIRTGTGIVDLGDDVEFNQNQGLQFVVENRTSDPASPVTGQLWIRTDL